MNFLKSINIFFRFEVAGKVTCKIRNSKWYLTLVPDDGSLVPLKMNRRVHPFTTPDSSETE